MSANLKGIEEKPEPPRDRYGRYLVPTGKKGAGESYTRATTVAKGMADTYGLEQWQQAMVANGMGRKPALVKMARNHPKYDDAKSTYREIVEAAFEASDGADGRRAGTALHKLTERHDLGLIDDYDALDGDDGARLMAYINTLERKGIEVDRTHVEEVLLLQGLQGTESSEGWRVAGTADRFVHLPDGRYVIADLKTGKSVDLGALEFAVQLSIYSNHNATFDAATGKVGERIEVDRSTGLIIHLPAQGEVMCQLHTIDLEVGYGALLCAMERREWQKEGKKVLSPYRPINGGTGGETAQRDWIAERIQRILDASNGHEPKRMADGSEMTPAELLVALWEMTDIPMPLPKQLHPSAIEEMDSICFGVEGKFQLALPPARPGAETTPTTNRKKK